MTLFRLFALLLIALAVSGCRDRHEWRQKTTVTVETPEGERSGSAVVEVVARFGRLPAIDNEVEYRLRGEAAVVEVAPGRYLFALLGGSEERFYRAARDRFAGMRRGEWLGRIPKQTGAVVLTGNAIPLLVTFDDVTDPMTVQRVDPDDLAAVFGPGVELVSVVLEITDERVTEGRVEAVLGWLEDIWPNRLDRDRYETIRAENRFANSLSANSFSTEISK